MNSRSRTLTILDVGHGNSAVLVDDKGTLVIDAGPRNALLEYLKESGVSHIDVVLVSHADRDHINGLIGLLSSDEFTIGRIRLNTDSTKESAAWDNLLWELNDQHKKKKIDFNTTLAARTGEDLSCGSVRVEVLGPSLYLTAKGPGSTDRRGRKITSNSISAVIRLSYGGIVLVVLTGDIDEVGIENLRDDKVDMKGKTLVFPHHGGNLSAKDNSKIVQQLIELASPDNVIFSIGRGVHSTPRPEIVEAVRKMLPKVYIACTQLSEHCADKLPINYPRYVDDIFAVGREKRTCCAGSVRIDVNTGDIVSPLPEEHRRFIDVNIPTPLCTREP